MTKNIYLIIIVIVWALAMMRLYPYGEGDGKTLRIGIHTMPTSLNPLYATNETASVLVNKIYEGLYYFDSQGKIKQGLAEKAQLYTKNNHWEITLQVKKNIFFANGKELTAEDVVATIKLLKNEAFQYPYGVALDFIAAVVQCDAYGFTLILKELPGNWEHYLTFKILNAWEIGNAKPATFREQVLSGTGPYCLKSQGHLEKIVLAANPYYLRSTSTKRYDFLEFTFLAYPPLAPLKLLAHEMDICELQPEQMLAYVKKPDWQRSFSIYKYKKVGFTYLVFNLRCANLTGNIRALFYNELIGRNFSGRFLQGRGEPVLSPFMGLLNGLKPEPRATSPLPKGVQIRLLVNAESKLRRDYALFLAAAVKPLGINLKIELLEYHTFLQNLKQGNFEMAISGILMDVAEDVADIFRMDSGFDYAFFQNPQMDALMAQAKGEISEKKRVEIYQAAHRIWLTELPFIPLFNLYYFMGVARRVGVPMETYEVVGANTDFLFNIENWSARW